MTEQILITEQVDQVTYLKLNRPKSLNALDTSLRKELIAALEKIQDTETTRAVVLTGVGRGFCSGADLNANGGIPSGKEVQASLDEEFNVIIKLIRALPVPVIASVNGIAAGAGCSIALACDYIIAAEGSSFQFSFTEIGLVPDAGSSFFLPRIVGRQRASELLLGGRPIGSKEAKDWGMVNMVVTEAELEAATQTVAEKMSKRPTKALAITRKLIDRAESSSLDDQLSAEAAAQAEASGTQDFKIAVLAFVTKSAPNFVGK